MSVEQLQVGDIVVRKSYHEDILFRITKIDEENKIVFLCGVEFRLCADAPIDDVIKLSEEEAQKRLKKNETRELESLRLIYQDRDVVHKKNMWKLVNHTQDIGGSFDWPGKVLHLDGDAKYLEKCLTLYKELKIPVDGYHLAESEIPDKILPLLHKHRPDILVITGHDALQVKRGPTNDINSYRNSKYFIQAVEKARTFELGKDNLVIFAGACQSYFEALIAAGANFASSPKRINIHTLDPVYVVEKIAYTPIMQSVNVFEMIKNTITGIDGIGGLETRGCFRIGLPKT